MIWIPAFLQKNKTDQHHYFESVYKLDDTRILAICTWSLGKDWLLRINSRLATIEMIDDTIILNLRRDLLDDELQQIQDMLITTASSGFTTFHYFETGKIPMIYFMGLKEIAPSKFTFRKIYQTEYSRTRSSDRLYGDIQSIIQEATNR